MNRTCRYSYVMLLLLAGALCAPAGVISISPASLTVYTGQTFPLEVTVAGVTDLYTAQFSIGFNPLVIEPVGITEGSFLAAGGETFFIPGTVDPSGSLADTAVTLIWPVPGVSGSGTLATAIFRAVGVGNSMVTLFNVMLLDSSISGIEATSSSGRVEAVLIPEPAPGLLLGLGLLVLAIRRGRR